MLFCPDGKYVDESGSYLDSKAVCKSKSGKKRRAMLEALQAELRSSDDEDVNGVPEKLHQFNLLLWSQLFVRTARRTFILGVIFIFQKGDFCNVLLFN